METAGGLHPIPWSRGESRLQLIATRNQGYVLERIHGESESKQIGMKVRKGRLVPSLMLLV